MARMEEDFLAAQDEETHNSLVLWKRFIDDIVAIWRGSKDRLVQFLHRLDGSDPDIKFTWNIDARRINYLDVDIYKGPRFDETGRLDTRTHIKETNSFQYVHASSKHPPRSSRGLKSGRPRDLGGTTNDAEFRRDSPESSHKEVMDDKRYPGGPVT